MSNMMHIAHNLKSMGYKGSFYQLLSKRLETKNLLLLPGKDVAEYQVLHTEKLGCGSQIATWLTQRHKLQPRIVQ